MRKTLLLWFTLSTTFFGLNAQKSNFFVEEQNKYIRSSVNPLAFVWATHYFKESNFGFFVFALVSPSWAEIYTGPNYTFNLNSKTLIEAGVGIGFETSKPQYGRVAGYLFFDRDPKNSIKKKTQALLNVEYGGSGMWYLAFVTHGITKNFSLGLHAQGYGTWGPRFQCQYKNFALWVVPGYSREEKMPSALTGLRAYF